MIFIVVDNPGENTRSQSFDTDSVTSVDSQKSHSLIGLNWLFSSNADVSKDTSLGKRLT